MIGKLLDITTVALLGRLMRRWSDELEDDRRIYGDRSSGTQATRHKLGAAELVAGIVSGAITESDLRAGGFDIREWRRSMLAAIEARS